MHKSPGATPDLLPTFPKLRQRGFFESFRRCSDESVYSDRSGLATNLNELRAIAGSGAGSSSFVLGATGVLKFSGFGIEFESELDGGETFSRSRLATALPNACMPSEFSILS